MQFSMTQYSNDGGIGQVIRVWTAGGAAGVMVPAIVPLALEGTAKTIPTLILGEEAGTHWAVMAPP